MMRRLDPGSAGNPVERQRAWIHDIYGNAVGRAVEDLPTPALLLDIDAANRNIDRMAAELRDLPVAIRPHIKAHKSVDLARRQVDAGAVGLSTATVWEAVALAWAGLDDIFVVNTVAQLDKLRILAELARSCHVRVAVDNASNVSDLSEAAKAARSYLGVLVEVDTGMRRGGIGVEDSAIALAKRIASTGHLHFDGLTGYEGHCSLEPDAELRKAKQIDAMDRLMFVADQLESSGIPCQIRSAGGTATWKQTAIHTGITEIQAGSYVVMDNFHARMVPEFEHALSVATTVISRPANRLIVDAGSKSVDTFGGPSFVGADLEVLRFDEEHGIFEGDPEIELTVGSWIRMLPGYASGTVNMYDVFHVVIDNRVVDVWPIFPRGPGHNGLLKVPVPSGDR